MAGLEPVEGAESDASEPSEGSESQAGQPNPAQRRYLIAQGVTGSGQCKRPGLSLEEPYTHELLELLHLMANCRRR